jgi:nucleotide-binding universal stress UspA family protein
MADTVLVPVDGSELSERILVHVQRLLALADAEVLLLHVAPDGPGLIDRKRIDELATELRSAGTNVRALVVKGDPAAMILAAARELGPKLIAMSSHGRSGIARFFRGSVAERVLRHADAPLLLANPLALPARQDLAIRKILVPLDGSELSAEILPIASDLARLFQAELLLFHAVETVVVPDEIVSTVDDREAMEKEIEKLAERVKGVRVGTRVVRGNPSLEILDAAREADLVALATHGRSGASRWAFGSVAEQVLRGCTRPLLVKRTGGFVAAEAGRRERELVAASRWSGQEKKVPS